MKNPDVIIEISVLKLDPRSGITSKMIPLESLSVIMLEPSILFMAPLKGKAIMITMKKVKIQFMKTPFQHFKERLNPDFIGLRISITNYITVK